MRSKDLFEVMSNNNKFVVIKNGQPINPQTDGQRVVTEFDNMEDANKYITILQTLTKKKAVTNHK
jgi:3-deoxy-D-manno-octulosonic acid (KDO) 8-phosphate synthase